MTQNNEEKQKYTQIRKQKSFLQYFNVSAILAGQARHSCDFPFNFINMILERYMYINVNKTKIQVKPGPTLSKLILLQAFDKRDDALSGRGENGSSLNVLHRDRFVRLGGYVDAQL